MMSPVDNLRAILSEPGIRLMPCCFDALSARLIEQAGFSLTFMSGFAVSATRIGAPDTGLISYGEMLDAGRDICAAVSIPVLGDGDTGYGNALNVKRTVRG
jgi:2-methylisocitrate lyase-like PEP mutase family enzyme